MTTALAAAFLGLAVWLCLPPRQVGSARVHARPLLVGSMLLGLGAVFLVGLPVRRLVLLAIVLASLADLARRFRRRRRRESARRRAVLLLETCESLAADLRSGLPPLSALRAAAADWTEFGRVARAAELGADVPEAMRLLAAAPGAGQARVLAAAWQVAHRSGAGLASALDLAAGMLREERAIAAVVETELAGARSTAVLLAVLPLGVLVLGAGAGGDPFGFLVATGPGLCCLAVGLLLAHLGLAWLDAIADGVSA
jgi:tight adherence protein B